jgi:ABC-type tungstate transport system permease subunit
VSRRERERLTTIYNYFKVMSAAEDLAALVDVITEALHAVLQAEHVFVFLADAPRGELWAQWEVDGSESMLCVR